MSDPVRGPNVQPNVWSQVYALADMHLLPGDQPTQQRQLDRFLERVAKPGVMLLLVGDTFNGWFERRGRAVGDHTAILQAFGRAAQAGAALHHVCGNRDFWVGAGRDTADPQWWSGFYRNCYPSVLCDAGIEPHGDSYRFRVQSDPLLATQPRTPAGGQEPTLGAEESREVKSTQEVLAIHGDQFCTRDCNYQRFRWLARGWLGRLGASLLPWCGAEALVKKRHAIPNRPGILSPPPAVDIQDDAIVAALSPDPATAATSTPPPFDPRPPIDTVLCGHVHYGATRWLRVADRLVCVRILPPWLAGFYTVWQAGQWVDQALDTEVG